MVPAQFGQTTWVESGMNQFPVTRAFEPQYMGSKFLRARLVRNSVLERKAMRTHIDVNAALISERQP